MTLFPAAVSLAKETLLTGQELVAQVMENTVRTRVVISPLAEVFAAHARTQALGTFDRLMLGVQDSGAALTEAELATVATTGVEANLLAAGVQATAESELAAGAGGAGNLVVSQGTRLRTIVGAGAQGLVFGLVLAAVEYGINRVKAWKVDIAAGRAHSRINITMTNALLDLWRKMEPETSFWHDTDWQRKKRTGEKRFRRRQRKRVRK